MFRRLPRNKVVVKIGDVGVQVFSVLVALSFHSVLGIFGLERRRHRRLRVVLVLPLARVREHELIARTVFLHQFQIWRFAWRFLTIF